MNSSFSDDSGSRSSLDLAPPPFFSFSSNSPSRYSSVKRFFRTKSTRLTSSSSQLYPVFPSPFQSPGYDADPFAFLPPPPPPPPTTTAASCKFPQPNHRPTSIISTSSSSSLYSTSSLCESMTPIFARFRKSRQTQKEVPLQFSAPLFSRSASSQSYSSSGSGTTTTTNDSMLSYSRSSPSRSSSESYRAVAAFEEEEEVACRLSRRESAWISVRIPSGRLFQDLPSFGKTDRIAKRRGVRDENEGEGAKLAREYRDLEMLIHCGSPNRGGGGGRSF